MAWWGKMAISGKKEKSEFTDAGWNSIKVKSVVLTRYAVLIRQTFRTEIDRSAQGGPCFP
jgi:hypothetical protein